MEYNRQYTKKATNTNIVRVNWPIEKGNGWNLSGSNINDEPSEEKEGKQVA
jgi:hypothetical protein